MNIISKPSADFLGCVSTLLDAPISAQNGEPQDTWLARAAEHWRTLEHIASTHTDPLPLSAETQAALYAERAQFEALDERRRARAAVRDVRSFRLGNEEITTKEEALPPAFYDALSGKKHVLFVGPGPLPTTAIAIHRRLNAQVTCIDPNADANRLARQFLLAAGLGGSITVAESSLEGFDDLARFDAIVLAFLVGVTGKPDERTAQRKSRLLEETAMRMARGGRMIVRTPSPCGGLIYPRAMPCLSDAFEMTHSPAIRVAPIRYDLPFTVIDRVSDHAH